MISSGEKLFAICFATARITRIGMRFLSLRGGILKDVDVTIFIPIRLFREIVQTLEALGAIDQK